MIPYRAFAKHLMENNVIATPAELHGHASGMIAVNNDIDVQQWSALIFEDYCFEGADQNTLLPVFKAMFDYAKDKLAADNFTFNPLLPSDNNPLSERLQALSSWCTSFLTGMAFSGLKVDHNMHEDIHGFIADLEKISKVETEAEDSQGEEIDYFELVEYVKAGAILVYQEYIHEEEVSPTIQ